MTLIYGASYTLWMYKRVIFGAIHNPHVAEMKDINCREFAILAILAVAVLGMGLYPSSIYRSGASSGKRFDCPCGTKQDLRCANELD